MTERGSKLCVQGENSLPILEIPPPFPALVHELFSSSIRLPLEYSLLCAHGTHL